MIRSGGKYPRELARLLFTREGEVKLVRGEADLPNEIEVEGIKQAFAHIELPASQPFLWTGRHPPRNVSDIPWSKAEPSNVYICWDRQREHILFVQERVDRADRGKDYLPWSYWSDATWRLMEPDEKLPLNGLEQLGSGSEYTEVFLHEGAKAANAVRALLDDPVALSRHPWGVELKSAGAAHLGWLGGAGRPTETDWDALRKAGVTRITLICDNDADGKDVVTPISRAVNLPMDALFFDGRFHPGFDLADDFPDDLFKGKGESRRYVGPRLADCCHPATWATRKLTQENRRGAPAFEARREFSADWIYVISTGSFIHRRRPTTLLNPDQFNSAIRPVSDVKNTADLLHRKASVKVDSLCYLPELPSGVVVVEGERKFNTHVPTRIEKRRGNIAPFYRFMRQMLPDKQDRLEVMRWAATLIARPDIRMAYGLLLCSPAQGVGKSTFTDHILAPLVGANNVSHPDVHRAVTSGFNSWLANTRLVVLAEMYVGHLGAKAYDTLKPLMTDATVTVNEKFRPEYELENRAHFVGSSNSRVPMFMAGTDRRWFVPEVTEVKQPKVYWRQFYAWLAGGGLAAIHYWAFAFAEKHGGVAPEDEAPRSSAKRALVESSLSDGRRLLVDFAEYLKGLAAETDAEGGPKVPVRVIVPIAAVKHWFGAQEHLSFSEKKMSERAMLEVFEDEGLNVRKGDGRVQRRAASGYRKITAIANFVPAADEKWADLAERHLWDVQTIRDKFDAL
ncbi:DUF5906 domain-containing protein [Tsuneonella sp. HG249]